ncbi:DNA-binding protein [Antrihabitans spumae]|uniref:DNA-binding protein n=1 Tax=Antrihabitans spumae TaxID=3373370 RepID=A0ABW7KKS9_9NOCA
MTGRSPDLRMELGSPREVADYLHVTVASLAQLRYVGRGPRFVKAGAKVLYRWSDVFDYVSSNLYERTDVKVDPAVLRG